MNRHHSPLTLQAVLMIPAKSTLHLFIKLCKTFLKYTEHPLDAMRGWDLPPAVLFPVQICNVVSTNALLLLLGGRSLLMLDFSMPYNIIFGSIFNLLTRKWTIVKMED